MGVRSRLQIHPVGFAVVVFGFLAWVVALGGSGAATWVCQEHNDYADCAKTYQCVLFVEWRGRWRRAWRRASDASACRAILADLRPLLPPPTHTPPKHPIGGSGLRSGSSLRC